MKDLIEELARKFFKEPDKEIVFWIREGDPFRKDFLYLAEGIPIVFNKNIKKDVILLELLEIRDLLPPINRSITIPALELRFRDSDCPSTYRLVFIQGKNNVLKFLEECQLLMG